MLQELPKVAVAMVSLAMVALLISLARNLMKKELVEKEHVERVALAEVEVPELWYSPYGERTHAYENLSWPQGRNKCTPSTTMQVLLPEPDALARTENRGAQENFL